MPTSQGFSPKKPALTLNELQETFVDNLGSLLGRHNAKLPLPNPQSTIYDEVTMLCEWFNEELKVTQLYTQELARRQSNLAALH